MNIFFIACVLLMAQADATIQKTHEESVTAVKPAQQGHVFVVSEWLAKDGCDEKLWLFFKELMAVTKEKEAGCIRAHATRQISHPGSPGKSKYTIVLLQEYVDITAFDAHCKSDYVTNAFKNGIDLVEDWSCRLFSEDE